MVAKRVRSRRMREDESGTRWYLEAVRQLTSNSVSTLLGMWWSPGFTTYQLCPDPPERALKTRSIFQCPARFRQNSIVSVGLPPLASKEHRHHHHTISSLHQPESLRISSTCQQAPHSIDISPWCGVRNQGSTSPAAYEQGSDMISSDKIVRG